jgi:hypothetical protein
VKQKLFLLFIIFFSATHFFEINGICLTFHVPHNFFRMPNPPRAIQIGNESYTLADENFNDVRVTMVSPDVLKKYIDKTTKTFNVIPEKILRENSPFTLLIEYRRPSGRIVTVQEPIREAGIIEKCYLNDEKITEKKGFVESIKSKVTGPDTYKDLLVSLRILKIGTTTTETKLCGVYETFDKKGLDIQLQNAEVYGEQYSCLATIIK